MLEKLFDIYRIKRTITINEKNERSHTDSIKEKPLVVNQFHCMQYWGHLLINFKVISLILIRIMPAILQHQAKHIAMSFSNASIKTLSV